MPAVPTPAAPGGTVAWAPAGRAVLGRSVLYTGGIGGAFVAWMDPDLVRPVVVVGTGDPGGPWAWGGQVAPESRRFLVAAFNGGFKFGDFAGGVVSLGSGYRDLLGGVASLIVYGDGSFTVGMWGRDTDPAKQVVSVRQNLQLLVDGGAPTAASGNPGAWGASVAGVATMRSAVGVDAKGSLLWAGGRLSPADLANAMVASGAVRAMQLDINPDWVNFNRYDVGADGSAVGLGLFGATGANRYLSPSSRDFVAVMVRGTVVPGSTAQVGAAPLTGRVALR
ncbi:MAG: phosphodiester glycosidase family protein [Acidimicrobiia bacterium]